MKVTLYKVQFKDRYYWGYSDDQATKEDEYDKQCQPFIKAGLTVNPYDKERKSQDLLPDRDYIFDEKMMAKFSICGIALENVIECQIDVDMSRELSELAEKQVTFTQPSSEYNSKCEVHISGQALATYNEVKLLEDSCTDVLQGNLNSGWRILASCPQPDQRRPDYILGRFNPDIDIDGSADRG